MSARVPVSVLVPIKNEAVTLKRALDSVAWADEIIVADSQSTDGSQRIAEECGARVVQFDFNGTWPKKKNWALESVPFKYEWVFVIDADEVLQPGAEEEFRAVVTDSANPMAGYWINRRFMFMGRWLQHAYYPNWNMRLFRHRLTRYGKLTGVDTQSGDNEVHEPVIVSGPTGHLRSEIDHYAFPSVAVFVEKHNRYSTWEACVQLCPAPPPEEDVRKAGSRDHRVILRQKIKRLTHLLPCRPLLRFLYVYIVQRGFLDGREGYYFARLHGFYEFLSVAKTYEMKMDALREAKSKEP